MCRTLELEWGWFFAPQWAFTQHFTVVGCVVAVDLYAAKHLWNQTVVVIVMGLSFDCAQNAIDLQLADTCVLWYFCLQTWVSRLMFSFYFQFQFCSVQLLRLRTSPGLFPKLRSSLRNWWDSSVKMRVSSSLRHSWRPCIASRTAWRRRLR